MPRLVATLLALALMSSPSFAEETPATPDDAAFAAARQSNTISAYEGYFAAYQMAAHASEAHAAIAALASGIPAPLAVSFCDHYDKDVSVAVAYTPVGETRLRDVGWYLVRVGQCRTLFTTNTPVFYVRAQALGEQRRYWGTGASQCASFAGPFDISLGRGDPCPEGVRLVGFTQLRSEAASGAFTYNFEAGG